MTGSVPSTLLKELRHQLASAVSTAKAYDVPRLCRRLNLADGTEQEAFASKYKYVQKRVAELDAADVLTSAKMLLVEEDHFNLAEIVAKIEEFSEAQVTQLSRRRLMALFEGGPLVTEIDEMEFIRGLWPIDTLPAKIQGFGHTLADDILRHWVRNNDLTVRELLEMLGFLTCSRSQLFKFLAAVTAPEVQTEKRQLELAKTINEVLLKDGYTLSLAGKISGSPYFVVISDARGSPADSAISATLAAFDPTQVHARWAAAIERRASEPEGAITLARTLLEDVCKWILDQAGEVWSDTDDLPVLYRKLAKLMKLAPDEHTERVFKQILGSCQSVVESLGALRNKLGDAHGGGPKRAKPQPRHAELAVNLSGAMATFLVSTWEARKKTKAPTEVR